MYRISILLALTIVASMTERALGHGFHIDIVSNKLVIYSEDPRATSPNPERPLYEVQSLLGPSTFKSADHPGFAPDTQHGSNGFTLNTTISFDALGPLWYSNGGAPVHSPTGVDLVINPQDSNITGSVTVKGSSTGTLTGFLIGQWNGSELGAFEHQLSYEFAVPSGLPTGAYAVAMRLRGKSGSNQDFIPSDPFVAVFNNGLSVGGANPEFPGVADQLFTSALAGVPEPSTFVLAGFGIAAALAFAWRKRRCS